jgi:ribosome-associated heat shock protein Hsp15
MVAEFEVLRLPRRRGPAAEAQTHYLETTASAERRLALEGQQRLAQISRPRPDARPDKRDRRRLMRLQRDQT